jgi:acyl-ACP thioesterase
MNRYNKHFTIDFKDVDFRYDLKMSALVDYMQETSNTHAKELGVDFSVEDLPYYWIVARAKMELYTYPKYRQSIRIETYPAGISRLFAVRKFTIYDENDKIIGKITGYYVLMDESHRPVRLKNLQGNLALLERPYEGQELEKLKVEGKVQKEDIRKVRSSEIDVNGHMNNAHYVRWATDMFSCKEQELMQIDSIETNYTTALKEEDMLKVTLYRDGNVFYIQGTSLDERTTYWTSKIESTFL